MGGVGPIPWDSIDRWAQRHGLNADEFDELVGHIQAMDSVYIAHQTKDDGKALGKDKPSES